MNKIILLMCVAFFIVADNAKADSSPFELRDIRVLIANNTSTIEIRTDVPYTLRDLEGNILQQGDKLAWTTLNPASTGILFGEVPLEKTTLDIIPHGGHVWVRYGKESKLKAANLFSGFLRCRLNNDTTLDLVNYVDIETYVTGVISKELYASFHREAYRAQAVASRTYAAWQMLERDARQWDVRSTQASQVYCGVATGEAGIKAREAVEYTRGIVCTWNSPEGERIFCTFFSSTCGGISQDVSNVMNCDSIPPLAGGVKCDYCRIAGEETYTWGPAIISKEKFTERMVSCYPAYEKIGKVELIEVDDKTEHGRPIRVKLIGSEGEQVIRSESLRTIVGYSTLKSTHCTIVVKEDTFRFEKGRGFGHGIGLCQWGAEGLARNGKKASEILEFYYPGSTLKRAW